MKTILASDKIIANYDYRFMFGYPNRRYLCDWIQKIDLDYYNILIKDPAAIRNFVSNYITYTDDKDQHGYAEYWVEDISNALITQKEDCDGMSMLSISIMCTVGHDARLCVGIDSVTGETEIPNHVFGVVMDPAFPDDYEEAFLVESTTRGFYDTLSKVKDNKNYYTILTSAYVDGRMWLHNKWAEDL